MVKMILQAVAVGTSMGTIVLLLLHIITTSDSVMLLAIGFCCLSLNCLMSSTNQEKE
ncbi:MAG: hypothetical protein LKF76_04020 [Eggerthellaceae bacterium]|jgi:hypothetical protein|nr:hypothetical protein [Eggerthellaceae bacterium]